MKREKVDLTPLNNAIRNRGMMEKWKDGLFVQTEEEGIKRANEKEAEAKREYCRLMSSKKNNGGVGYQQWALNIALGSSSGRSYTGKGVHRRG